MNRTRYSVIEPPRKDRDPDENAPARHCAILTLIGLAAIAVSIALPPDENAPAPKASRKERAAAQLVLPAAAAEPTADAMDAATAPAPTREARAGDNVLAQ